MFALTTTAIFLSIHAIILKCVYCNKPIESNPDAKRLYDDLLSNYNRLIRPVNNNTDTLTVRLGIKLSQLTEVNLRNQVITASIWVVQEWVDCKLKWDPLEYGGLEDIYVPSELIWLPDIVLFNNADGNFEVTLMTKANLKFTGVIKWEAPAIYKLSCEMNVLYFPFDEQHCLMKFGSWTYNGFQVDLKHVHQSDDDNNIVQEGIDLSEFLLSVEWDILGVPARKNDEYYPCCKEPYADITFNMIIRRKTLFYTVNLIIPLVGITFLTVLVFYLPSDSGEKVSLCSSILVSLTVFFLLLAEIIPPTSLAVPLLGKYLLFTMTLVTLSICVTVCVLNVHFRSPSTHEMSPWVSQVFLHIMPHLLLMRRPPYSPTDLNDHYYLMENAVMNFKERMKHECCSKLRNFQENPSYYGSTLSAFDSPPVCKDTTKEEPTRSDNTNVIPKTLSPDVLKALNGVCFIAQQIESADKENEVVEDWKYISMVLDRFFLWTFTIACIVGTCIIIFQAPSLYDQRPPIDEIVRTQRAQLMAQKNYSSPVPYVLHVYDPVLNI